MTRYNWYYHTVPQKNVNNRRMYWPRGRVWGGSSSLNAMVYVRGHAEDYNRWAVEGAAGWSYEEVLPYFKKAQTHSEGAGEYRGGEGPLHVSRYKGLLIHPLRLQKTYVTSLVEFSTLIELCGEVCYYTRFKLVVIKDY